MKELTKALACSKVLKSIRFSKVYSDVVVDIVSIMKLVETCKVNNYA